MEEDYLEKAIEVFTQSQGIQAKAKGEEHQRDLYQQAQLLALLTIAQELRKLNNKLWQGVRVTQ